MSSLALLIFCLVAAVTQPTLSAAQISGPRIDGISDTTLPRAGRLRIFGANFGAIKANSEILINGVAAPVSRWSDTLVVAYVPEFAQAGAVPVQVVTSSGSSNKLLLDIKGSERQVDLAASQANGTTKWRCGRRTARQHVRRA